MLPSKISSIKGPTALKKIHHFSVSKNKEFNHKENQIEDILKNNGIEFFKILKSWKTKKGQELPEVEELWKLNTICGCVLDTRLGK